LHCSRRNQLFGGGHGIVHVEREPRGPGHPAPGFNVVDINKQTYRSTATLALLCQRPGLSRCPLGDSRIAPQAMRGRLDRTPPPAHSKESGRGCGHVGYH
jgi:hypothetical protein